LLAPLGEEYDSYVANYRPFTTYYVLIYDG